MGIAIAIGFVFLIFFIGGGQAPPMKKSRKNCDNSISTSTSISISIFDFVYIHSNVYPLRLRSDNTGYANR